MTSAEIDSGGVLVIELYDFSDDAPTGLAVWRDAAARLADAMASGLGGVVEGEGARPEEPRRRSTAGCAFQAAPVLMGRGPAGEFLAADGEPAVALCGGVGSVRFDG